MTTVIVIGGGVAGMSAAHELIERGYTVRVFERQALPGGKGPQRLRRRDGHERTEGPARGARLPLLPALLSPHHRHDGADPGGGRSLGGRQPRAGEPRRDRHQRPHLDRHVGVVPAIDRRRPGDAGGAVRDREARPDRRGRGRLREPGLAADDELSRAVPPGVRAAAVGDVPRRRAAFRGVPQDPRRRADPEPDRGDPEGGQHRRRRDRPDRAVLRPVAARDECRPPAQRPDERRLADPVAGLVALARGRLPPRGRGHRDRRQGPADRRRHGSRGRRRVDRHRRLLHRCGPGRADGPARLGWR